MAKIPKVKFKVNLAELFGDGARFTPASRQAIGQAIIDRIIERTADENIDKYGRSLGSYSKSYADSLFGQVHGKRAGAPVTLRATGDMLGTMDIVDQSRDTITLGFGDAIQNAKAYGHISGMAGHPTLDGKVKKRDFFGLPQKELDAIASDFEDDVRQITRIERTTTREQFEQAVLDTISEMEMELIGDADIEGSV